MFMNKEEEDVITFLEIADRLEINHIELSREANDTLLGIIKEQQRNINKLINYIAARENKDYEDIRKEFDIWVKKHYLLHL